MAIDTAQKRRSAGGVPYLPMGPNVTPDAAKPVAWRQESAWSYSGIPPFTPATGGFGSGASGIGPKKTFSDENLIGGGGSW